MPSVREFRIPIPLSLEEYKIAQLYMIQKKSKDESTGEGSGVEILKNEPYYNGPGGNGQYTEKLYHVQSHLPNWVSSFLSKGAFVVKECAWNAYPYTKTLFTISSFEKFSISMETKFLADSGKSENVFDLNDQKLKEFDYGNIIDYIDMCSEKAADYNEQEDPLLFRSKKTGRGPLPADWLDRVQNNDYPHCDVICSYKLCNVEFRYWGIQKRMENFILDYALRRTMLKAHQQAWAWQDEWNNLSIEDIRRLEEKTQKELEIKFNQHSKGSQNFPDGETICQLPSSTPSLEDASSDDDFFDAAESLSICGKSTSSFHSTNSDEVFCPTNANEKTDSSILLIVIHSGAAMGFPSNIKDDLTIFRSTMADTLRAKFPSVSQDLIHIRELQFRTEDLEFKEMLNSCLLKTMDSANITNTLIPLVLSQTVQWEKAIKDLKNNIEVIHKQHASKNKRTNTYLIGDALGGIACYDSILRENKYDQKQSPSLTPNLRYSQSNHNRSFDLKSITELMYDVDIKTLFLFNCPLAYYIIMKKLKNDSEYRIDVPVFNIFYPMDSSAARIEPLLHPEHYPPEPAILNHRDLWNIDGRMDYMLPCPERPRGVKSMAQILYSAFWESHDIASLILKEAIQDSVAYLSPIMQKPVLSENSSRQRWRKRRTFLKVRNLAHNHRSQDVITLVGQDIQLTGKFAYGPFDFTTLSGESIELSIKNELHEDNNWEFIAQKETDSSGKVLFNIPKDTISTIGIYKVKQTVLGDKSETYSKMMIIPPQSKCVVFSIDGSFAATVSIRGKDPRIRAAAVDVVRFWSDMGYLIIYISSRPDIQRNHVAMWLKQHNFPQGVCFFAKGIYHDPTSRKGTMLKNIVTTCSLQIEAVYGSLKDVAVYSSLDLDRRRIFICGRQNRKVASRCTILSTGYTSHLEKLKEADHLGVQNCVNPRLLFRNNSFSY